MFAKAYLEITNRCNLHCAFCPGSRRAPRMLSPKEFRQLAGKLRPYTDYLYLHVMGEPLLHPQLGELMDIAWELGFRVVLTTNGTLLERQRETLLTRSDAIYKISISLHSYEANRENGTLLDYVDRCIAFQKDAGAAGIITVLRLWNLDSERQSGCNIRNEEILRRLHEAFPGEWKNVRGGPKMAPHCYLEWGERFAWPSPDAPDYGERRFCMALRDQIGVLCDGTVVPCCLDGDGALTLGNLFTQSLEEILQKERAKRIYDGFSRRTAVEELCRKCDYALRFQINE